MTNEARGSRAATDKRFMFFILKALLKLWLVGYF